MVLLHGTGRGAGREAAGMAAEGIVPVMGRGLGSDVRGEFPRKGGRK